MHDQDVFIAPTIAYIYLQPKLPHFNVVPGIYSLNAVWCVQALLCDC
jgi:hypothetical protein